MDDSKKPIIININTIPKVNVTKLHDPQHPNHTCVICRESQKQAQRDGKVGYAMCADCAHQVAVNDTPDPLIDCDVCKDFARQAVNAGVPGLVMCGNCALEFQAQIAKAQQQIAKAQEVVVPKIVELERLRARVRQLEGITSENDIGHDLSAAELHEAARQSCCCSGLRCTAHLAQDELRRNRPKVVAIIGMRHMVAELNEAYAGETCDGNVVLGMFDGTWHGSPHDNDVDRLWMHKRRIDVADELFVVNFCGQTDALVNQAIEYAELCGKAIRWLVQP